MAKRKSTRKGAKCRKGKEKVTAKKEDQNYFKKITITYDDPYDTDPSSDDEEYRASKKKNSAGRVVREILLPNKIHRKSYNRKSGTKSSDYKGVTPRKSGRFAAQIRDLEGNRIWLGTFDTEVEAAYAYSRKKEEFDGILEARKRNFALGCDHDHDHDHSSESYDQHNITAPSANNDIDSVGKGDTNVDMMIGAAEKPVHEDEEESVLYLLEDPVAPSLLD